MKKKQIANLIMVAVILVIVAAGVLGVGYIRGWFDTDNGTYAVLRDMRGVIHLERAGVFCPVEEETVLRAGDRLSCDPGATAVIYAGDGTFTIGEKASLQITDPAADHFSAELLSGEMFANCENTAVITFAGKTTELSQTTALISVRTGAQSVSVLRGQVGSAAAGQILNYVGDDGTVGEMDIHSLNDFGIAQIRKYDGSLSLCFTAEDLDLLVAERQQALQELINSQTQPPTPTVPDRTDPTAEDTTHATQPGSVTAATPNDPQTPETEPTVPPSTPPETTPPPSAGASCTITIRCDTILNNMDDLEPGKAEFVPSDGVILYPVTVTFEKGESVFDVLKRVCGIAGIQLEYSLNPVYDSYYIEGINHLYEFDCGEGSGWTYLVNDWSPNYGCSAYTVEDGDVIVFAYSCQGLGSDIG